MREAQLPRAAAPSHYGLSLRAALYPCEMYRGALVGPGGLLKVMRDFYKTPDNSYVLESRKQDPKVKVSLAEGQQDQVL